VRVSTKALVDQGSSHKKNKSRKAKSTVADLPEKTCMNFGAILIPNIKAYVGSLPAWADIDVDVLKELWSDSNHDIICGWDKDDHVRQLICTAIYM
jgi:hypothetical protein